MREREHAEVEVGAFLCNGAAADYRIYNGIKLLTEEHGNDCGRRFISAETVVVAGGRNGKAQQLGVFVNALYDRGEECEELHVLHRRLAGIEQVLSVVGRERPVVVLAGAVHAVEGLFMQQADHTVAESRFLHYLHCELVLVGGGVRAGEYRSHFVLTGSNFVMLGL